MPDGKAAVHAAAFSLAGILLVELWFDAEGLYFNLLVSLRL